MRKHKTNNDQANKTAFDQKLAILTFISGIVIGVLTMISADRVAARSGQYDRAKLSLTLGSVPLRTDCDTDVIYATSAMSNGVVFAQLPLVLHNAGEKTLENPSVTVRYPSLGKVAITDELGQTISGRSASASRRTTSLYPFDYISFTLSEIHPGENISVDDLIHIAPTVLDDSVYVTNLHSTVDYRFEYAYQVTVTVSGKDQPTKNHPINLSCYATPPETVWNSVVSSRLSRMQHETRRQSTWWQYLLMCLRNPQRTVVVITPSVSAITVGNESLYQPNNVPEGIRYTRLPMTSWKRLLH